MKKSISIWSFRPEWDWDYNFRLARESGFDGIEIDISKEGALPLNFQDAHVKAARALAKKHQLELSGLASLLYWEANGASDRPETRTAATDLVKQQIHAAAALGIDTILMIPGSAGVDFIPDCEEIPYDVAMERARALIVGALPLAEEKNVTLAIENVWNKLFLSPVELRDFVDSFQSAHVGVYLDVGNVLLNGYPEHWIKILGHRIRRVHFKDFKRSIGNANGFCDLLAGDVNWREVMQALRGIPYDGWIAAEMIPPWPFYRQGTEVLIPNTSRAMDRIFAM